MNWDGYYQVATWGFLLVLLAGLLCFCVVFGSNMGEWLYRKLRGDWY